MRPVALFCMATRLAVHLRRRGRIAEVWKRRKAGELTRHVWAVWFGVSDVYGYLFCEVLHEFDLVGVSESWKVATGDELHWHTGSLADIE